MTIRHHPSVALLVAYAAGTTSEAEALAISAHMTYCPDCRDAALSAEAIGGALLEDAAGVPLHEAALQSVLSRLDKVEYDAPRVAAAQRGRLADVPADLPMALSDYVSRAMAQSHWRSVAPGIQQLPLPTSGRAKARLLTLKPGTVLPAHGHRGTELTLLLAGSYTDELGRFALGDMAELDETVTHRPQVDEGEVCMALVVTDAPLKFEGWIARLAQPFIGI